MSEQSHHTTFSDDPIPQYHYDGMSKSEIVEFEFSRRQLERDAMQGQAVLVGHQAVFDAFRDSVTPIGTPKIARPPKIARTILHESSPASEPTLDTPQPETGEEQEFPADDSETMQFKIPTDIAEDSDPVVQRENEYLGQEISEEQADEPIERVASTATLLDRLARLESHRQQELHKLMDRLGIMIGDLMAGQPTKQATERLGSLVYLTQDLRGLELQRQAIVSDIHLRAKSSEATPRIGDVLLDRQPRYDNKTTDERLMATKAAIQEALAAAGFGNAKGAIMELENARGIVDSMVERDQSESTKLSRLMHELYGEQSE